MKYETKKKIKKFFKEKWKVLLASGIFLTIGLVVMLVGFSITGWSIIAWLQSPFAVTTLIFVLGGLFFLVFAFLFKKQVEIMK